MPESRESVRLSEQCSIIQHRDIACLRNKKIDRNRIEFAAPLEIPIEKTKNKVRSELAQTDLEEKFVQHATLSFRQHPEPLTVRLDLIQLAHEWGIFVYRAAMLTDQAARATRSEKPKRPPVSPAKVTTGRNRPEKIKHKDNYRGRFFALLALMILTEIFILTYLMR